MIFFLSEAGNELSGEPHFKPLLYFLPTVKRALADPFVKCSLSSTYVPGKISWCNYNVFTFHIVSILNKSLAFQFNLSLSSCLLFLRTQGSVCLFFVVVLLFLKRGLSVLSLLAKLILMLPAGSKKVNWKVPTKSGWSLWVDFSSWKFTMIFRVGICWDLHLSCAASVQFAESIQGQVLHCRIVMSF